MIDFNKYTKFVNAVTSEESKYGGHFYDRLRDLNSKDFPTHRALTAALGLSAESGEFTEIVKKILFQGKPVTQENLFHMKRELGDIMVFYTSMYSTRCIPRRSHRNECREVEGQISRWRV